MDIKNIFERFVSQFHPSTYVLGGGLAVALQTGRERETEDIDIIDLEGISSQLYPFQVDHERVRIDHWNLDYAASIEFSRDLLQRNTEEIIFRGKTVPCLSKEALLVSKLASEYQSVPFQQLGNPIRREKDVKDMQCLYESGVEESRAVELLGHVPHLRETRNLKRFYQVAMKILTDKSLPLETGRNIYGLSKIGSLCLVREQDEFLSVTREAFAERDTISIARRLDRAYPRCQRRHNPFREYKREVYNGSPHV